MVCYLVIWFCWPVWRTCYVGIFYSCSGGLELPSSSPLSSLESRRPFKAWTSFVFCSSTSFLKVYPGKLMSFLFLLFFAESCSGVSSEGMKGSSSSKSSKRVQSSSSFTFGMKGDLVFLRFSQSSPLKKGCSLISWTPLAPRRLSASQRNRFNTSLASGVRFDSSGMFKVFFQCRIF